MKNLKVGSKLKNPSFPIWLICSNDNWGVLFSPNVDILNQFTKEYVTLKSWYIKHYNFLPRFTMHYYSASRDPNHEKRETLVQIDAREALLGMKVNNYYENSGNKGNEDLLELAVQTM